jgi:hypothetical protein
MNEPCKCLQNLNQAFEDVVGVFASLVDAYPLPDEELCTVAQAFDRIHAKACRRLGYHVIGDSDDPADQEHPVLVYLYARIRERGALSEDARSSRRGAS